MARSSRSSLPGAAVAAAQRVIGRGRKQAAAGTGSDAAAPVKKAPVKKAPVKKAPVKKAPVKKAPAKKAPVKKAPAKKAPAKKAPAKKAPAKKAPAKKAPAKKAPAKKAPAKKAPAKKAPAKAVAVEQAQAGKPPVIQATAVAARSLVVGKGEKAWTRVELEEVLSDLATHRGRLETSIEAAELELTGLLRESGDSAGQDQADVGTSSFELDHEMTVLRNERDMVNQIDRAMARVEDGTYGRCESCGQPIGKARVMAFPRATLCLSCKQREERR